MAIAGHFRITSSPTTPLGMNPPLKVHRRQLYRATNRILNDNSLHFILISLLFLPATFSACTTVKFYFSSTPGTDVSTMFDPFNLFLIKTIISSCQNLLKTLIIVLAFACFVILPTVAGVALITYSANQAIQRKPLTLSSTFKSLLHSYIPLLNTIISGSIILIIVFLVFTLSPIIVIESIKALGFHFGMSYVTIFVNSIVSYALAIAIILCMVIWGSAAAITVLESKSGVDTLRQSANQSTEFRRHSFSIVFVTGFGLATALAYSTIPRKANWTLFLQVGAIYLESSLFILMYVVANTVLYVQGKVANEEEIVKTAIEGAVSGEFVRLAVNDGDGEVLHELAKENVNGGFNYLLYILCIVWVILSFVQFYHLFTVFNL